MGINVLEEFYIILSVNLFKELFTKRFSLNLIHCSLAEETLEEKKIIAILFSVNL